MRVAPQANLKARSGLLGKRGGEPIGGPAAGHGDGAKKSSSHR